MNCTFDAALHAYYVDGRRVPSVTGVLAAVGISTDFSRINQAVLEHKRQLGAALHACLDYQHDDDLDETTVDEEVRPLLDSYKLFMTDTGFKALDHELRRWPELNGMRYGMTADVIGAMGGEPWLIDFKTSAGAPSPGWAIQLAGYEAGLQRPVIPPFRWRRMSLQLLPEGRYYKKEWTDPLDRQEWISALYLVYRRINRGEPPWEDSQPAA